MSERQRRDRKELGWIVYVMATAAEGDAAFFKVGITRSIPDRLLALQTGCPMPIREILYHHAFSRETASAIERGIHASLAAFRTSGEWFRFDLKSAADKHAFNTACREHMDRHIGPGWKWNRVNVGALRAALKEDKEHIASAEKRIRIRQVHRLVRGRAY